MHRLFTHPRVKRAIIHPLVFAVFPVLFLYTHNMGKGYLGEAVGTACVVLLFAGVLWLLTKLLVRDWAKAAIITSLFFFLFFSYGHAIRILTSVLERLQLSDKAGFLIEGSSSHFVWLVVWGLLFVSVSLVIARRSGDLGTLTSFLNVVALALAAIVILNLAVSSVNTFLMPRVRPHLDQILVRLTSDDAGLEEDDSRVLLPADSYTVQNPSADDTLTSEFVRSWQESLSVESAIPSSDSLPDIYYIILDMYARSDFLKEVYHIDNSEFLTFLTEKGFYVADESRANYPHTTLSLPSSLNFMYLDEVAAQVGEQSTNHWPLVVMLKNSRIFQQLRSRGYTIVTFSSGYGISEIKDADIYMTPPDWRLTEFQKILIEDLPFAAFRDSQDEARRELVRYAFEQLPEIAENDSPTFVFAHIPSPHYPFVFGPNGEPVQSRPEFDYEFDEFADVYGNQLRFVSREIQTVIEEILERSSSPPIIIVQSDHGPNSAAYTGGYVNMPEKLSILNTYYFPDQDYTALYKDITPVNTFRIVLNQYLGASFELLEDRSYFSEYWDSPFLFEDVTDEVVNPD